MCIARRCMFVFINIHRALNHKSIRLDFACVLFFFCFLRMYTVHCIRTHTMSCSSFFSGPPPTPLLLLSLLACCLLCVSFLCFSFLLVPAFVLVSLWFVLVASCCFACLFVFCCLVCFLLLAFLFSCLPVGGGSSRRFLKISFSCVNSRAIFTRVCECRLLSSNYVRRATHLNLVARVSSLTASMRCGTRKTLTNVTDRARST